MADFNFEDTIALLARTPAAFDALLRGLPDAWVRHNEGGDSWSTYDIVGHLASLERTDWMVRVRRILEYGEAKPFDRVDRFAQLKQREQSIDERLDDFSQLRRENLAQLQDLNLQPQDFSRKGVHPILGVVTLAELLATWAAHDMTHLHQLSRVMAYQYDEAVGRWRKFLGVLQCQGHSAPP